MKTQKMKMSALKKIISEELFSIIKEEKTTTEARHEKIVNITKCAGDMMSAVEKFEKGPSECITSEVLELINEFKGVLKMMLEQPGSFVVDVVPPKLVKKTVTLKSNV